MDDINYPFKHSFRSRCMHNISTVWYIIRKYALTSSKTCTHTFGLQCSCIYNFHLILQQCSTITACSLSCIYRYLLAVWLAELGSEHSPQESVRILFTLNKVTSWILTFKYHFDYYYKHCIKNSNGSRICSKFN